MILFPLPGLDHPKSPREFYSLEEAERTAAALGTDYLTLLKVALFAEVQREMKLSAAKAAPVVAETLGLNPLDFLTDADAIDTQLRRITENWKELSPRLRDKIQSLLAYKVSVTFAPGGTFNPPQGAPPVTDTPAHYSRDTSWMRDLVVVAKNVPLWLVQLSLEYGREIRHLDEIPEGELDFLKSCGVNGLWLLGLWQRSDASKRIKRLSGNNEAESSAYSVFAYTVDEAYGGENALAAFRARAAAAKIRLGCDMVPNHTGIDSLWLREHPDWFMQTPVKPFPGYTFTGENLSTAPAVSTRIEDGYLTHKDAAVVFRHDENGNTRYIYHGNDGTGLAWNDTAQLNHLVPAVRAALIDTALSLAQNFDFIRFDAAMTLLKEHYRRLWFPAPGAEAVIASRSAFAMADAEFERLLPEFWRELVTAFEQKSPGTLLMAEAFWLTENYFIRNIGIHRVYNSAFMHFLHEEKNEDFSRFMTDHLKNGHTLPRFVNYLSTPDEKSAAEIFGRGDKYFGALKLMATLPGLPLLAPGQLEGFSEKYAMDQTTPRLGETKQEDFIGRHAREIGPLFAMRHEFSDEKNLTWLSVSPENAQRQVIAYETGATRRFLVIFNNSGAPVSFSVNNLHFSLAAYESRVIVDAMAAVEEDHNIPALAANGAETPTLDRYYAGVTVPVSALRSNLSCAIGEFADLRLLADWCALTGQKIIALLPVSDTGSNSSPYSALSAFALHPVYLRLDDMPDFSRIEQEVAEWRHASQSGKIFRFDDVLQFKLRVLRQIYEGNPTAYFATIPADFSSQEWLVDYAVYKNIKSRLGEAPAYAWAEYPAKPGDIAALLQDNTAENRRRFFAAHLADTGFYVWLQYHAELQLAAAAAYARSRGIFLKGDLPILLERDSVDVWLNPQLFRADLKAGAPPDQYSADGQNWGFPVYDWAEHRKDDFAWWKSRVRRAEKFFSAYRIDHVLGFFRIWCLDANDESGYCGFFLPSSALDRGEIISAIGEVNMAMLASAANRERPLIQSGDNFYPAWEFERKLENTNLSASEKDALRRLVTDKSAGDAEIQRQQGYEILSALRQASRMLPCAEDLGVVPDYVGPTLAELKILSLCVLRWRHRNGTLESPRDYTYLSVATPSVHDSTNLREWLQDEGKHYYGGDDTISRVVADIYESASALALLPIQDLLALDTALHGPPAKERVNVPGTVSDKNWSYRIPIHLEDLLKRKELADKIRSFTEPRNNRRPSF